MTTTCTHKTTTDRKLPFGGAILSTCVCGARRCSDGKAIDGGVLVADGWYVAAPRNERQEAIDRLNSEGYSDGPEPVDAEDEFFAGRE